MSANRMPKPVFPAPSEVSVMNFLNLAKYHKEMAEYFASEYNYFANQTH